MRKLIETLEINTSNLSKYLYKLLIDHCLAHKQMLEAEDMYRQMRCTRTIIAYQRASEVYEKSKMKLINNTPDGLTAKDLLADFLLTIKGAYDDYEIDEP